MPTYVTDEQIRTATAAICEKLECDPTPSWESLVARLSRRDEKTAQLTRGLAMLSDLRMECERRSSLRKGSG